MRPCFVFNALPGVVPVLQIFEEIGFWGVQAKDFSAALNAITEPELTVEINSPGGDYFAALAMHNMLRGSGKKITTKIMGVAASAATIVFAAGDVRTMPSNVMMMVHSPASYSCGTADEHRDTAAMLDSVSVGMRAVYARDSALTDEQITTMLATDTWLTAAEALAMGLANEVTDAVVVTASFDAKRAQLPVNVMALFAAKPTPTPPVIAFDAALADQIVSAANAAKLDAYADIFVLNCATLDEAKARMQTAREVQAFCTALKRPDDIAPAIQSGATLQAVRAAMVAKLAASDVHTDTAARIDNTLDAPVKKPVTVESVWAKHRAQSSKNAKS